MDFNATKQITQQEETENLIIPTNTNTGGISGDISGGYYGTGVETIKVVEYMLSSMSTELLHKFPDNSAFDFDYTQSSIWSPLVPHPSRPPSPAPEMQGKRLFHEEDHKFTPNLNEKISDYSCVFNCFKIGHNFSNKRRRKSGIRGFGELGFGKLGFGQLGANSGNVIGDSVKGWKKILKAASKRFKKTTMKKKKEKENGVHLKLSLL